MSRTEITTTLNKIFQEIFDDDQITINDSTSIADIDAWDSFEHIALIATIEEEFSIKFDLKEAGNLNNVGTIIDKIIEKIG